MSLTPKEIASITDFSVRETTQEEKDADMPYLTSSMIEAINTCPKWGLINSVYAKHFVVGFRQTALEAGSLMHDVLAMLNLYQIGVVQGFADHAAHHGRELLTISRYKYITQDGELMKPLGEHEDEMRRLESIAYNVIGSSEYYDDPSDNNRTLSNLEHCALELCHYWLMNLRDFNVFIADRNDPLQPVGMEMSLDVVFHVEYTKEEWNNNQGAMVKSISSKQFRFIGLADVVYENEDTQAKTLGEYKTAARMGDAWRDAFQTRHQLTAYNAALLALFPEDLTLNTIMIGSAIPVRKTTAAVQHFTVTRDRGNIIDFLRTAMFADSLRSSFDVTTVVKAPMFTHSCNRYFKSCALLDLCTSPMEDQQVMFEQMPVKEELSPSEVKALMKGS